MSAANRGKYAEGEVRKHLKKIDEKTVCFDWERVLDAHAAGGRFAARTGDFAWYAPNAHGVLECKEVEHAFRLPYKNYELSAIAKVYKRQLAGGRVNVVICHMPMKVWRNVPFEVFRKRNDQTPSGSWDLSEFPTFASLREALAGTMLAL